MLVNFTKTIGKTEKNGVSKRKGNFEFDISYYVLKVVTLLYYGDQENNFLMTLTIDKQACLSQ